MGESTFRFSSYNVKDCDKIIVYFTSFRNIDGSKKDFDWVGHKSLYPSSLFVQDVENTWYHGCLDTAMGYIAPRVKGKKALMIGSSAGGYGALLIAHILGTSSMAINPQTIIDPSATKPSNNKNWEECFRRIKATTRFPQYMDIGFISGPQHHIHYSKHSAYDKFQAERMNVTLIPHNFKEHGLAGHLKESGVLKEEVLRRIKEL